MRTEYEANNAMQVRHCYRARPILTARPRASLAPLLLSLVVVSLICTAPLWFPQAHAWLYPFWH